MRGRGRAVRDLMIVECLTLASRYRTERQQTSWRRLDHLVGRTLLACGLAIVLKPEALKPRAATGKGCDEEAGLDFVGVLGSRGRRRTHGGWRRDREGRGLCGRDRAGHSHRRRCHARAFFRYRMRLRRIEALQHQFLVGENQDERDDDGNQDAADIQLIVTSGSAAHRHRIVAVAAERIATREADDRHRAATDHAVTRDCLGRVLRAGRRPISLVYSGSLRRGPFSVGFGNSKKVPAGSSENPERTTVPYRGPSGKRALELASSTLLEKARLSLLNPHISNARMRLHQLHRKRLTL